MKYTEIQQELVKQYRIDLCDGTKCKNDRSRTHAHLRGRRVCKWCAKNSFESTFTLMHEIGHIENNWAGLRRCEEEYFATMWAIQKCKELGMRIQKKTIKFYQDYIDLEIERGVRRGGSRRVMKLKI